MAVEIPVYVNISDGFDNAVRQIPKETKKLETAISKNVLNIPISIPSGAIKNVEEALIGTKVSAKDLKAVLQSITAEFNKQSKAEEQKARSSAQIRNLAKAYGLVEQRLTGVYNKSSAAAMMVTNTINKVQFKLKELRNQLAGETPGSATFNKINYQIKIQEERLRKLNLQYKQYQVYSTRAGAGVASSMEKANSSLAKHLSLTRSLTSLAATYLSIWQAARFIKNVREVTSEFEMQRVALGGIIQDAEQANMLFRQIKAAAIESPFEIKDLVTFTKQLSAYRIETEDLFDITMRLADVSAGLGVDMNRLVLAYGQVRAASVLRGQELRQFTEAGIPLVELLAQKFSDLNGKMVSTADVFDLISKRAVPFEMIAEIFDDMTSAGGTFYKMQERQAETLAGQWANLKDAASIMYDEIGNTSAVHSAMEGVINDAKYLMLNWRSIATILKTVGIQFVVVRTASLFLPKLAFDTELAKKATDALARASALEAAQQTRSSIARGVAIRQLNAYSAAMAKAAAAQTMFGRSMWKIAATMAGGGWVAAVITGLTLLTGWLISARKEANRLGNDLEKIGSEGATSINRSVANFRRLADAAVEAAEGSDEQNKALAELKRTYGDIIPSEEMQAEKLRALKGDYDSLTAAIEQKINMQIKEQKINAATDYYSGKIQRGRKKAKNLLAQYGLDKEQINAVLNEVQNQVDSGMINIGSSLSERGKVIEGVIKNLTGLSVKLIDTYKYGESGQFSRTVSSKAAVALSDLSDIYIELNDQTKAIESEMDSLVGSMGVYSKSWDKLKKAIKDVTVSEEDFGKKSTFTYKKEKTRKQVEEITDAINSAFKDTKIDISSAFANGGIDFEALNKFAEQAAGAGAFGLDKFVKNAQKSYESIVPPENMVRIVEQKFAEISKASKLTMDDVQGYLYRGGNDIRKYVKDLQDSLQDAKDKVNELNLTKAEAPSLVDQKDLDKANAYVSFLGAIIDWLEAFNKKTKTGSYQQDPFIAQMQNRIKFMQDFKKGYDDLRKYLGPEGALGKISETMLGRGQSLGLDAAQQQRAATDLSSWYDEMIKMVEQKLRAKGVAGVRTSDLLGFDTTKRGKDVQDLQKLLQSLWDAKTDFDTSEMKKAIDTALKRLAEEIKRSETARNFFQNIFDITGDQDLAATMSVSVYGDVGEGLQDKLREQLKSAFVLDDEKIKADNLDVEELKARLEKAISTENTIELRKLMKYVVEENKSAAESVVDTWEKADADILQGFAKALEKYASAETRSNLIKQKTQTEIQKVVDAYSTMANAEGVTSEQRANLQKMRDELIEALRGNEELELKKLSDDYVAFFSEINVLTAEQAALVRSDLRKAYFDAFNKGAIDADILRRNLRAIDEQFKKLSGNASLLGSYLSEGIDGAINKLQEYSSNIDVIAAKMQRGDTLSKNEQGYVTNMLSMFGGKFGGEQLKGINSYETLINAFTKNGKGIKAAGQAFGQMGQGVSAAASKAGGAIAIVDAIVNAVNDAINAVQELIDELNKMRSEENKIGGWYRYLSDFNKYAFKGWNDLKSGNAVGVLVDIANSIISIFNNIQLSKVNKINDKIEDQSKYIEDLDYQYQRLETSIKKAFGSDYITNYNKQLETLYAQQEAYLEQAELERSKGKSSDSEKVKEFEKQARDTGDKIQDMQSQLSEFFSGTDLTSAAKDFANAWIEAYKEYGSVTTAMKEKFQDMVQSMVENSLAARVMQDFLRPIFDEIDRLSQEGSELSTTDIAAIAEMANAVIPNINDAMTTLMNTLAAGGYNVRQQPGQFTGIKRNIANASEESINGLTQATNVNNFYMQSIAQSVAQILAIMSGGTTEQPNAGTQALFNNELALQYMSALPNIDMNMAELLRCVKSVISDKNFETNASVIAVRA